MQQILACRTDFYDLSTLPCHGRVSEQCQGVLASPAFFSVVEAIPLGLAMAIVIKKNIDKL